MTMCYDGLLALPANCTAVAHDEMQYVEGGGTWTFVLTAAKQKSLISFGVSVACSLIGAAIGAAVGGGVPGAIVGALVGSALDRILNSFLTDLISKKVVKGDWTMFSVNIPLFANKTIRI